MARTITTLALAISTFFLHTATSNAQDQTANEVSGLKQTATAILRLPSGWDHATISLYQQPRKSAYMNEMLDFDYTGESKGDAAGDIEVPKESFVGIEVVAVDGYEEYLSNLPTSGIHRLDLKGLRLSTSLLRAIERVKSIRQLNFVNCAMDFDASEPLDGLPELQTLRFRHSKEHAVEAHARVAQWAAKCEKLQYFYDGVGLTPAELSRFDHHAAPLFLQVSLAQDAASVLRALAEIPQLVALNLSVEKDVPKDFHVALRELKQLELVNWSNGNLDMPLLTSLSKLETLRTIRFQGSPSVEDEFIENIVQLESLEALSFNVRLSDHQSTVLNESLLEMERIVEIPKLTKVSATQLIELSRRHRIRSIRISGLAEEATETHVAKLIRAHPEIVVLELAQIEFTNELADAICNCENLDNLSLSIEEFDGDLLKETRQLSELSSLDLSVRGKAENLEILSDLPNLGYLSMSLGAVEPMEWSFIAESKSLKHLSLRDVFVDDSFVNYLEQNKNLISFSVNPSTLRCFLTETGFKRIAECSHLESISIGGFVSPSDCLTLAKMRKLRRLSIYTPDANEFDDAARQMLKETFADLDYFGMFTMTGVGLGDDGVFQKIPDDGRKDLDAIEGQLLDAMLGDHLTPKLQTKLADQIVVVDFWGTWCGPCINFMPELERLQNKFGDRGLTVLGVHSKMAAETANAYLKEHEKPWPNIIDTDGTLAEEFKVPGWPSIYVFGRDGRLRLAAPYRYGLDRPLQLLLDER